MKYIITSSQRSSNYSILRQIDVDNCRTRIFHYIPYKSFDSQEREWEPTEVEKGTEDEIVAGEIKFWRGYHYTVTRVSREKALALIL